MSGLQTRRTGVCFLAQAEDFYLFRNVHKDVARTQPSIERVLGIRRPKREVDHSLPNRTQFKNKWSNSSSPLICLYGQLHILPYYTLFELQNRSLLLIVTVTYYYLLSYLLHEAESFEANQ